MIGRDSYFIQANIMLAIVITVLKKRSLEFCHQMLAVDHVVDRNVVQLRNERLSDENLVVRYTKFKSRRLQGAIIGVVASLTLPDWPI